MRNANDSTKKAWRVTGFDPSTGHEYNIGAFEARDRADALRQGQKRYAADCKKRPSRAGLVLDAAQIGAETFNPEDWHGSLYEYAKSLGVLPSVPKHYIAGSGSHGCLYDQCEVYETRDAAVSGLAELFSLGRTRKARLNKSSYLELNPARDGAEYCEVSECDCDNPAQFISGAHAKTKSIPIVFSRIAW